MGNIKLGEYEYISLDKETENIISKYVDKILYRNEKPEINLLSPFECECLLYRLCNNELDKNYKDYILNLALKSIECNEITLQGKVYNPDVSLVNSLLLDKGRQVQILKSISDQIHIKFIYDELCLFLRIREMLDEIEECELETK